MISEKIYKNKNIHYFIIGFFLLWIVLFEFILPVNKIFPKPSVVILSFGDLWQVYNFGINYLWTFSIIIFSIVSAYFFIWLLRVPLIKSSPFNSFITSLEWFSKYIPAILIGLFLLFWFPEFEYTDGIFAFLSALFFLIVKFRQESKSVKSEYVEAVQSLGAGDNFIIKKVIWKSLEAKFFRHFFELNFYLWTVLIVFEYFRGNHGLGAVIRAALQYKDLSAFFTTLLIIGISIFVIEQLAKVIQRKY